VVEQAFVLFKVRAQDDRPPKPVTVLQGAVLGRIDPFDVDTAAGSIEPSAFTFETSTLKQIKAVKDRIAELTAEAAERAGVSIERVLNELP